MTAPPRNPQGSVPPSPGDSDALLRRLEALHPRKIDLSLDRIQRLLERLGRPQDRLPPVVHIAGTNGKGSVAAFTQAILEAAGRRVHSYTSPHLVRFHERIALAGAGGTREISEQALIDVLLRAHAANGDEPITFFEVTTAAAFLAFAETPADYLILETGLGGRLDATNTIERPALTVITPIADDHADFLGTDLESIAREKAGILKRRVPCIVSRQPSAAWNVVEARAGALGVPLIAAGRDWDAYEQHGRLLYQTRDALLDLPLPRLNGRHQIENAGAAIAAARALLGSAGLEAALATGLASAVWPARLERLGPGALYDEVTGGTEIWLDGGHNRAAGVALAQSLAELEERVPRPLHLVVGMMTTKDALGFLRPFEGLAEWVATVPVPQHDAGYAPEQLAKLARTAGLSAEPARDVAHALALGRRRAAGPVRVLICGSLYLAGHVLAAHAAARAR